MRKPYTVAIVIPSVMLDEGTDEELKEQLDDLIPDLITEIYQRNATISHLVTVAEN